MPITRLVRKTCSRNYTRSRDLQHNNKQKMLLPALLLYERM